MESELEVKRSAAVNGRSSTDLFNTARSQVMNAPTAPPAPSNPAPTLSLVTAAPATADYGTSSDNTAAFSNHNPVRFQLMSSSNTASTPSSAYHSSLGSGLPQAMSAAAAAAIKTENQAISNYISSPQAMSAAAAAALKTENQAMSNYISSPDPDLPNQYNIILAGEDEDEEERGDQTPPSPTTGAGTPSSSSSSLHPHQGVGLVGGTPAPYRSYTIQFKLNALDWYYKNGENKNLTAKMFQVDRKRIRDWLLDEPNLRSDPTPERTKRKRNNCLPQYKEIETALYRYYLEQRERGLKPKNAELRSKSLEFASEYGYGDAFKASVHWLCNWKRRNRIAFVSVEPMNGEENNGEEEDEVLGMPQALEEEIGRLSQSLRTQGEGSGGGGGVEDGLGSTGGEVLPGVSLAARSSAGVGLERVGVSVERAGGEVLPGVSLVARSSAGVGLERAGLGLDRAGVSVERAGVGLERERAMERAGVGLERAGVGLERAGVGLERVGIGLERVRREEVHCGRRGHQREVRRCELLCLCRNRVG